MMSESGLSSQDTDDARHIQEVLNELREMQQPPRLVTSPDDLEALEREIRQRTDRLGSLLVGYHIQQALDAAALQAEQERLVRHLAQAAQKRRQGQGADSHGSRPCGARVGHLLPP